MCGLGLLPQAWEEATHAKQKQIDTELEAKEPGKCCVVLKSEGLMLAMEALAWRKTLSFSEAARVCSLPHAKKPLPRRFSQLA